jgi:N-acetylglutamate synthase-like GNAT family acetyltransferase
MTKMSGEFVPGAYWTRERARRAVDQMAQRFASPQMQDFLHRVAAGSSDGNDSAARAAEMAVGVAAPISPGTPVSAAACHYRRGRASDIAALARIISQGGMPPLFIEEFVEGFVAVQHEGETIACGGLEIYDDCGVIRSVVVDAHARGQGIGERIVALLVEDGRCANLTQIYLTTVHARPLFARLSFVDAPFETWAQAPRVCWQYQFLTQHPQAAVGVYAMVRRLVERAQT